jgi:hypothetical protein
MRHRELHLQWAFAPISSFAAEGEKHTARHPSTGTFLDVKNGTKAQLWERIWIDAQIWVVKEGGFILIPMTGKYLNAGYPGKERLNLRVAPRNSVLQATGMGKDGMIGHEATGAAAGGMCLTPFDHSDVNQQWMLVPQSRSV